MSQLPISWPSMGEYMPRNDSGVVWHYTDAAGLIGIIESGRLWASSPLTLNDASELQHGMAVVRDCWRDLRAELDATAQELVDRLVGTEALDRIQATTFLLCAAAEGDLLNQW